MTSFPRVSDKYNGGTVPCSVTNKVFWVPTCWPCRRIRLPVQPYHCASPPRIWSCSFNTFANSSIMFLKPSVLSSMAFLSCAHVLLSTLTPSSTASILCSSLLTLDSLISLYSSHFGAELTRIRVLISGCWRELRTQYELFRVLQHSGEVMSGGGG
jgi:hypothetical protein